jgi:tetratricopeptide (TPR) repeat protein
MYSNNRTHGKHRLNKRLLLGTVILVPLLGAAAYFWHAWQMKRLSGAFLERADQLEQEENWSEAATYLYRYLQVDAENAAIRIRLAKTFDKSATSRTEKSRAIELYYRAVGLAPDRGDLRGRLAQLLLEFGRHEAARQQADVLVERDADNAVGVSVRALALYALSRTGSVPQEQAFRAVREAAEALPGNAELVKTLVHIYRQDPALSKDERDRLADQAMDRLVEARPEDFESYFSRFRYRQQRELAGAELDLESALALAPNNAVVLAAAGDFELRRKQYDKAGEFFARAIQVAPGLPDAYVGWGESLFRQDKIAQAISTWRKGLEFDPDSVALNFRLAEVLVSRGQLDEARDILNTLESAVVIRLAQQSAAAGTSLRPAVNLLRAKWLIARGEKARAIPLLRSAATLARDDLNVQYQAWLMLGAVYAELGEWSLAATGYERAAGLRPSGLTLVAAARARSATGETQTAVGHCVRALQFDPVPDEAHLLLVRLRLSEQLQGAAEHRDWQPVHAALAAAKKALPDSADVAMLKVALLKAQDEPNSADEAAKILENITADHPEDENVLPKIVIAYEQLGKPQQADQALRRYASIGRPVNAAMLQAELLARRGQFEPSRQVLLNARHTADGRQRRRVTRALANLDAQLGQYQRARTYFLELWEADTSDILAAQRLAEIALATSALADLQRWEKTLHELEGPDGNRWRLFRGLRLVAEAQNAQDSRTDQARELLAEIEAQRADWAGTQILRAHLARRDGRIDKAIAAYQAAIHLGTDHLGVYERLVRLLYQSERFGEVNAYLAALGQHVPLSPELASLQIVTVPGRGQMARAARIARAAVDRNAGDATARLCLAQTLLLAEQTTAAEIEFKKAIELAPDDPRGWAGLVSFYVSTRREDDAKKTLADMSHSESVPATERAAILGQGYELLGERRLAETHYREAERLAPNDASIKTRLALYLLDVDPHEAEQLLRQALELDPQHATARRALISVLANRTDGGSWQEAEQLLAQSDSGSAAERRLHAHLLIRRGSSDDLSKARDLLEKLVRTSPNVALDDHLDLARLHEAAGRLRDAQEQFELAASRNDRSVSALAACAAFFMRHEKVDEANGWIEQLESTAPEHFSTVSLRARWLDAAERQDQIEPLVESYCSKQLSSLDESPSREQLMLNVANLYRSLEHDDAAERWYRRTAEQFPEQYRPLAHWLGQHGRTGEAIQLCALAAENQNTPQAAIVLAELLVAGNATPQEAATVERLLNEALEKHPEDGPLLFTIANLRLTQQRSDDAVKLLERVVQVDSKNVAAWNNLAALLAERPQDRQRALDYINLAMEKTDRNVPLLMDTKATILLHLGKNNEAVSLLEQVVKLAGDTDPRFHFHLSVAYDRVGDIQDARRALAKAHALGLTDNYLSSLERDLLAQLDQRLARP